MEIDGGRLSYQITLDFKKPVYPLGEYELFREFYKKLYAALSEQVALKKNS
jgi:hypothetical protein